MMISISPSFNSAKICLSSGQSLLVITLILIVVLSKILKTR